MAIPLSIVTRHFSASYDQLAQKQQIRGKALKQFAKHNRKSSAFVVKQIVSRRFSSVSRERSSSPINSNSSSILSAVNLRSPRTSMTNDRGSIISEPEVALTPEQIAQNRSIAQFKKEMEAVEASKKKKDAVDARTLCVEYQQHAKFVLTNLKTLSAIIGDKSARKTVRDTIRQSMRQGPGNNGGGALAALRAKVNALKGPTSNTTTTPTVTTSLPTRKQSASGIAGRPSTLAVIEEDEKSDDDDDEVDDFDGSPSKRKVMSSHKSNLGSIDEKSAEGESSQNKKSTKFSKSIDTDENKTNKETEGGEGDNDDEEGEGEDDMEEEDDDEDDDDDDGDSFSNHKSRRKSSATSTLTPSAANVEIIAMQLFDLVDKLIKFHVPNGSTLRDLLEVNTDFDDDAAQLLATFRTNMNLQTENDTNNDNMQYRESGMSLSGKTSEMRDADMLERLDSPTWGGNRPSGGSMGKFKKRFTNAAEVLRNKLQG